MAEIIKFRHNDLDFSHVMCSNCNSNKFYIEVDNENEIPLFKFIICTECKNTIAIWVTPVWYPDDLA